MSIYSTDTILYQNSKLIPDFIGKLEQMEHDWAELQVRLKQEGIANLGELPQRTDADPITVVTSKTTFQTLG